MNIVLWVLQALLALMFVTAGIMKSTQPIDSIAKNLPWVKDTPAGLVRFIGISELLGAIGLILPAATHILPWLTPLAAVGLAVVMVLAAVFHASRKEFSGILVNVVVFIVAAVIIYGRLLVVPA